MPLMNFSRVRMKSTGPYPGFFLGVPSSTEGARIEAPKAPRGWGAGRGVPSPLKNFCILNMKMMHFGAFLVGLE
jgi:hypothetical protein